MGELDTLQGRMDWEKSFYGEIGAIAGRHLLINDSYKDRHEAIDLFLPLNDPRLTVRIRSYNAFYKGNERNEFTMRYYTPPGILTEYEKIMKGGPKYLFYAFSNKEEKGFIQWFLGDLDVLRHFVKTTPNPFRIVDWVPDPFIVFDLKRMPTNFIKASSEPILQINLFAS